MTGPAAPRPRRRSERGSVPIELALGVGLLVLPIAVLVLSFPTWVERQSMARSAAQEAARLAVLATDPIGAERDAVALVDEVAANHGLDPEDAEVCLSVHPLESPSPERCTGLSRIPRGAAVTAAVSVRLPALTFPGLSTLVPEVTWTARATERVDLYRSR